MNIDRYTFEEFKARAAEFHGYPAPGLLLGGYMVAMAKRALPEGTLFEAVVETKKCLPDAVQLLTLCSAGNNWMKVISLGRYAVSLFDKFTGKGFRVHLDVQKLTPYPEIKAWLLKEKSKQEQDSDSLLKEIEAAGENICTMVPIRIQPRFLGHAHMGSIAVCPRCSEAYPQEDGPICRGCQGEAPYSHVLPEADAQTPTVRIVSAQDAVGEKTLHDMTEIIPGESKGVAFSAGQILTVGDVCRLQQMGRFSVAVERGSSAEECMHENEGAEAFAKRMAGDNIRFTLPPKEGKITFTSAVRGLLHVNSKALRAFNMIPDVMAACRQDGTVVSEGAEIGGTRVIPLYINKNTFAAALEVLAEPLFSVIPLRKAKVGILVTGTELFKGLIQDKFIPLMTNKVEHYECSVVAAHIAPDDKEHIDSCIKDIRDAGADLLIITGGLSVDPEDVTRAALLEAGLTDVLYGAPALPGAMSLVGRIPSDAGEAGARQAARHNETVYRQPVAREMQVLGVPACALYFKTTLFDILLPRVLAGRVISRPELAAMGEGGLCMNCKLCTWPKCFFVK